MKRTMNLIQTRDLTVWKKPTTILYLDSELNPDWVVAEGDDLDRNVPAIELNLKRIIDESSSMKEALEQAVSYWIDMYCTFLCGKSSNKATKFLVNAIHKDSELRETFIEKAVCEIKRAGTMVVGDQEETYNEFIGTIDEEGE